MENEELPLPGDETGFLPRPSPGLNTGLLIKEPPPTDHLAGDGRLEASRLLPGGDWTPFLPDDEGQGGVYFDSMACVSFSALNVVETLVNMQLSAGMIPSETVEWLKTEGYIGTNGKLNLSDRFTAKMSGTTRTGNYMTKVWDSIRNHGVLPEADWAFPNKQRQPVFDWDDYYAPIPQALKDKALKFRALFDVGYEWLAIGYRPTMAQYKAWLGSAPVHVAGPICSGWNGGGVVGACNLPVSHATMIYKAEDTVLHDFDHYVPFRKRVEANYPFQHAIRGLVLPKNGLKASPIDPAFAKKQAGLILLAVEDRGSLWYVTPEGRKAKIGNKPEEVEDFLQGIRDRRIPHVGITNENLAKIPNV